MQRHTDIEHGDKDRAAHGEREQGQYQATLASECIPQRNDKRTRDMDPAFGKEARRLDLHPVEPGQPLPNGDASRQPLPASPPRPSLH